VSGTAPLLSVDVEVERRAGVVSARLDVAAGERLALFGPSGAGKTTVVEAVAGLVRLRRGVVLIGGSTAAAGGAARRTALPPRLRGIGLVRQPTTLFPHLTVEQNVAYGAGAGDVAGLLERLGLADLRSARPAALSGGQRQRAALGRALATPYRVLLLDEPLSAIDGPTRGELRELTASAAEARQAAAVLVTHDLPEAQAFATTLGIIDAGAVLQLADPSTVVRRPATRRVAELVGYTGFVPAGGDGWYAIHPDRVVPAAEPARGVVLAGTVVWSRPHGARHECRLAFGDGDPVDVRLDEAHAVGAALTVTALDPPVVPSGGDASGEPSGRS
jgi:molybdate transport system ATP-binding protein